MTTYVLEKESLSVEELKEHKFINEGYAKVSPQNILAKYPDILLTLPEIEISPYNKIITQREYPTTRGSIDIVYVTKNAEIILVETKLLRNPESHRSVVAQVIDYAKAFTNETLDSLRSKVDLEDLQFTDFELTSLYTNIQKGNFKILIVGDRIHPNIIGMVDSIHSAPHLAFSIYMVELNPYNLDSERIILNPPLVSKTTEIERNVITIEIDSQNQIKIESSLVEKPGKNNKPKITEDEYLNNISNPNFIKPIRDFWKDLRKNSGDIVFGVVGFSGGITLGNKRTSLIWMYDNRVGIISKKTQKNQNIDDKNYLLYLDELKMTSKLYDKTIGSNRVEISFNDLGIEDFIVLQRATINLMNRLKTT